MGKYDDMLRLPWPRQDGKSVRAKQGAMPLAERAKIFLPFAALKGFEEEIAKMQESQEKKVEHWEEYGQKIWEIW